MSGRRPDPAMKDRQHPPHPHGDGRPGIGRGRDQDPQPRKKTTEMTNNSTVDVLVLSGSNKSDTDPQQGYQQDLAWLKFEDGSWKLESGKKNTLVLEGSQLVFNLLVSQPFIFFPVYPVGLTPDFSARNDKYDPVDIPQDALTVTQQALHFRQNLMTSPSSKLAQDFNEALKKAQKAKKVEDLFKIMNDFFKDTDDFKKVTFPAYSAVESYLKMYGRQWLQPAKGSTEDAAKYWIYAGSSSSGKVTDALGTITATKHTDHPTYQEPMCGFTIELEVDGSKIPLTYSNGKFSANSIELAASFAYKGRFTGKPSDTQLLPYLIGTMTGRSVFALPLSPTTKWQDNAVLKTLESIFKYGMMVLMCAMGGDFIYTKVANYRKGLKDAKAENQGADPTDQQVANAEANSDTAASAGGDIMDDTLRAVSDDQSTSIPRTDDALNTTVSETRTASKTAQQNLAEDNMNGSIKDAEGTLTDLAKIDETPAMDAAADSLKKAQHSVDEGDISEANSHMKDATGHLNKAVDDVKDHITEEERQQFTEDIEAHETLAQDSEDTNDAGEDSGNGDDPIGDGDLIIE